MRLRLFSKGFTLMEMIVIIIIMGILAGIAIPRYTNTLERQRAQEGVHTLVAFLDAQRRYALENNGQFAAQGQIAQLDIPAARTLLFCTPVVASADPIASIRRDTATPYLLGIEADGDITCTAAVLATCQAIGYAGAVGDPGANCI